VGATSSATASKVASSPQAEKTTSTKKTTREDAHHEEERERVKKPRTSEAVGSSPTVTGKGGAKVGATTNRKDEVIEIE
jgi:hypothetical protein